MTIFSDRSSLIIYLVFFVGICTAFSIFVGGGFVFDDYPNLSQLARIQEDGGNFWNVVFSNNSGPTGRPLAMFFFALQYADWPTNPVAFQWGNIVIHALNSLLVYRLFYLLLREGQIYTTPLLGSQLKLISLLGAASWAFHPGNVSSVLYVVQRMNLLSVFFGLCALVGVLEYLKYSRIKKAYLQSGQVNVASTQRRSLTEFSFLLMLFSALILLSVFSKENGILFLGLLPLVYFAGLKPHPAYHRYICWLTIVLCMVSLVVFLTAAINYAINGYGPRDFTLSERCLTQVWLTVRYIVWFWFPSYLNFNFLHDDVEVITTLFNPLFVVAVATWVALICMAWKSRLFRFGLAWFAISHLLESTIVPLEMVFEHRNYLATIGFAFVLAGVFIWLYQKLGRTLLLVAVIGICFYWAVNFFMVAKSWSSRENMVTHWSASNPHSARLYAMKGGLYLGLGRYEEAEIEYKKITNEETTSVMGYLLLLQLQCVYPQAAFSWADFVQRAVTAKYEASIINLLGQIMTLREAGDCSNIDNGYFWAILKVLQENAKLQGVRAEGNFLLLEGRLCIEAHDFDCYIQRYEAAAMKLHHFSILDNLFSVYSQLYGTEAAQSYIEQLKLKMEAQNR